MEQFLLPEKDRVISWRELRKNLAAHDDEEKIEILLHYWSSAPICKYSVDSMDVTSWPTPWELISENSYCSSAIALMMAHSLILSGFGEDRIRLDLVRDRSDDILVVVLDNDIVLNYSYAVTEKWDDVKESVFVLASYIWDNNKFINA